MPARIPLTEVAQEAWKAYLRPGAVVLDATAGNGLDTLYLAEQVGPKGKVYSIDIQESALHATARLLESSGMRTRVNLKLGDHSMLDELFPSLQEKALDLVCFNLGYLPGGDHNITTNPQGTVMALEKSLKILGEGDALSVIAYRGHRGALEEHAAVASFFENLPEDWHCVRHLETGGDKRPGPVWWLIESSS